jgi:hypothetical protein
LTGGLVIRKAILTTGSVLVLFSPTAGMAQNRPSIFVGGGVTIPVGDYADLVKTGWMATGGVVVPVGTRGIFIPIEGVYGRNSSDVTGGGHRDLYGGTAGIGYRFGEESRVGVYVIGAGGFLVLRTDPGTGTSATETELAYFGAGGVDIPVSRKLMLWIETRYFARGDVKFVPVFAGLSVGL